VALLPPMIERLTPPASDADLTALAQLLVDAVESGSAVSFSRRSRSSALGSGGAARCRQPTLAQSFLSLVRVTGARLARYSWSGVTGFTRRSSPRAAKYRATASASWVRSRATGRSARFRTFTSEGCFRSRASGVDAVEHQLRANHRSGDTRRRFGSRRLGIRREALNGH
jgi:hypothetical protein